MRAARAVCGRARAGVKVLEVIAKVVALSNRVVLTVFIFIFYVLFFSVWSLIYIPCIE